MTKTSHPKNPYKADTEDDEDKLLDIVSWLVVDGPGFFGYCSSPITRANIKKALSASMPVPGLLDLH
jgi:hypothetical protein